MSGELKSFPHHRKVGPCIDRPPYRDGKRKRAVKVFTIADESAYLLIFGVPSIDLLIPLKEMIQQVEEVQQLRKISHPESEAFTETYIAKFRSVNLARRVKRRLDDSSFYGGFLHIAYAPEYESVAECRVKMHSYRRLNGTGAAAERELKIKQNQRSSSKIENTGTGLEVTDELSTSACTSMQAKRVSTPTLTTSRGDAVLLSNPYAIPHRVASTSYDKHQSGDALDDSRNYWASKGFDFLGSSQRHSVPSTHSGSVPLLTEDSLVVQQSFSRQPVSESAHQEHSAQKWPYLPQSVPSTTVPVSKDLTGFIPRSVIKANRLLTGIVPSLKERKYC